MDPTVPKNNTPAAASPIQPGQFVVAQHEESQPQNNNPSPQVPEVTPPTPTAPPPIADPNAVHPTIDQNTNAALNALINSVEPPHPGANLQPQETASLASAGLSTSFPQQYSRNQSIQQESMPPLGETSPQAHQQQPLAPMPSMQPTENNNTLPALPTQAPPPPPNQPDPTPFVPPQAPNASQPQTKSKLKMALLIIGVIILLAIAGGITYFFIAKKGTLTLPFQTQNKAAIAVDEPSPLTKRKDGGFSTIEQATAEAKNQQQTTNNAQRKSDILTVAVALQVFFLDPKNQVFPKSLNDLVLSKQLIVLPKDPSGTDYIYLNCAKGKEAAVFAKLEEGANYWVWSSVSQKAVEVKNQPAGTCAYGL